MGHRGCLLSESHNTLRKQPRSQKSQQSRFLCRAPDLERVLAIGVDKWIDQQLHPASVDDHGLDMRLAHFRTLRMSTVELAKNFPANAVIRQLAEGKRALPSDPEKRAIYEAQVARYREKQE